MVYIYYFVAFIQLRFYKKHFTRYILFSLTNIEIFEIMKQQGKGNGLF